MSFDKDFYEVMDRTVTVAAFTGYSTDGYGTKTFSTTSYTLACYAVKSHKLVKDGKGDEVLSSSQLYCPPHDNSTSQTAVSIGLSDRITLPAMFGHTTGTVTPPIISVEWLDDDTGRYTNVIYI